MPGLRLSLALLALLAVSASAQEADTTRALGEVVVGASSAERAGVERVPVAGALARDPAVLADVARLVRHGR
jgi:hypothetical protein